MPSRLESRVRAHLDALAARHLRRALHPPAGLDLTSNDYLELSTHPRLVARMIEETRRHGCGSTGSRLLRGHRDAFASVERAFAAFKKTERALYFSSGYLASLAVLTTFAARGDTVVADRLNHASLRDGVRLSRAHHVAYRHGDAASLVRALARARGTGQVFVVTESLFSMDGDEAPLAACAAAARDAGALLIVDEAHAVGVFGAGGRGLLEEHGASAFLSIDTAGKALGAAGAFVSGPGWAIDYLEQRARPFVFSTAPPPALAGVIEESLAVVTAEPERRRLVLERAGALRRRLAAAGLPVVRGRSQIVPVVLGGAAEAAAVAEALRARGFDVRAIRPPTVPAGTSRLRVSVHAGLAEETLQRFADTLEAVVAEVCPHVMGGGGGPDHPAPPDPLQE